MTMSKLNELPSSKDEYWNGSEKHTNIPVPIAICKTHAVDRWQDHIGYKQEGNVALCTKCPWGTPLAGHLRVLDGRIVNLRTL